MHCKTFRILIVLGFLSVLSGPAWSQPRSLVAPEEGRLLGGHRFIPSELIANPFITTDFETQTGLGLATLKANSTDYNLGALAQYMRLQVAPLPWLALRLGVTGNALSGINQDAALNIGASAGYDVLLGASAGWKFDRLRVAGSLDALLSQSDQFAVGSAIEQSLKVGKVDASTLLVETKSAAVGPGVQAAYGFNSTVGTFGHLRLEFANESVGAKTQGSTTLNTGAALSVDLMPSTRIPVGLLAGYNLVWAFPSDGPSTTTHNLTTGVFYTGRPDLSLGLEGTGSFENWNQNSIPFSLNIYSYTFGIHYFW